VVYKPEKPNKEVRGRKTLKWQKISCTRLAGKHTSRSISWKLKCFTSSQNFLGCMFNRATEWSFKVDMIEGRHMLTELWTSSEINIKNPNNHPHTTGDDIIKRMTDEKKS